MNVFEFDVLDKHEDEEGNDQFSKVKMGVRADLVHAVYGCVPDSDAEYAALGAVSSVILRGADADENLEDLGRYYSPESVEDLIIRWKKALASPAQVEFPSL